MKGTINKFAQNIEIAQKLPNFCIQACFPVVTIFLYCFSLVCALFSKKYVCK